MLKVDPRSFAALGDALRLYDASETQVRSAINRATREYGNQRFGSLVQQHTLTKLDSRIAETVRTRADQQLTLEMGVVGKLKSGTPAKVLAGGVEYGAKKPKWRTVKTSRKGKTYRVKRRVTQQMPDRNKKGRMFWPSLPRFVPGLVSFWIRAVVDEFDPGRVRS